MTKTNNATTANTIQVRTMEIPRNMAFRSGGMMLGLVFITISFIMIATIILAIPGFLGLLVGFMIMYAGMPKESVDCVACGESYKVKVTVKDSKCDTCGTLNPIKWVKAGKKKRK
ncbi:hypothetical protein ACFSFY_02560 [Sporosarcina siberiensis]|uniref:Zinc-ribbon containing domain-containing protein n=1 Tax=Sporosarcina siberiensis TaxID=1365606 RepID=A0ABW4SC97_9BACL